MIVEQLEPEPRKTTLRLPEHLMRALRVRAATEFTSMTDIMIRALERELKEGGEKKK